MSLAHELDGAEFIVGDEELGLMFVWYGGAIVRILDESGDELNAFTLGEGYERKLQADEVRRAIVAWRAAMIEEENES